MAELLGTKIRALYQRKKGRDLFDPYYALIMGDVDCEAVMHCFRKYIGFSTGEVPSSCDIASLSQQPIFRVFRVFRG